MECVFCEIAAGNIPGDIVYQDETIVAFRDISPAAPTHILIIPRKHITSLNNLPETDMPLIGHIISIASKLAVEAGISEKGYRLVFNCGEEGGQVVSHLHLHLLGGRKLSDALG